MTNITIDKDVKLSKTHFANLEELQEEILFQIHSNFEITNEHKKILDERLSEIETGKVKSKSWSNVRKNLKRNNA